MSDLISRAEAIKTVKFYESFCDPYPRVIESLEKLPSAQPNNECEKCVFSPFEQFRQTKQQWIPCSERPPEELVAVNITWVNHDPVLYYKDIKDKPFTATGVYFKGKWYWWSATVQDYLTEYGRYDSEEFDESIECIAWMPLPDAYEEDD